MSSQQLPAGLVTRRQLLKAAAAAGVAAAVGRPPASAQTACPQATNGAGFYRFRVGSFTVMVLADGTTPVPRVLPTWGANPDRQEEFRRTLESYFLPVTDGVNSYHPVLVDTGRNKVLIDTGLGPLGPATTGKLAQHLRNAGVNPEDVDTVFITHCHPDHIGGLNPQGRLAFPRARLVIGEVEFNFWTSQAQPTPAVQQNILPLRDRFVRIRAGQEIVPGLMAVESFGHTPGHLSVRVQSGNESLMVFGDAAGHYILSLRHLGSYLVFDMNGPQAAAVRRRLFAEVADQGTLITAYHFPFPAVGRIRRVEDHFEFVPAVWTW